MQNLVFCKINLFDALQTVTLVNESGATELAHVDLQNLGHTIASVCNVRLNGSREYTESIADDIRVANTFMYHSNHEINIEVSVEGE